MTTLNDAFERELTQEDKGYESGSQSLSIPTPLRRPSRIYHISMSENISFSPTTPLITAAQHSDHTPRSQSSVCHCLTFSNSDEESATPDNSPLHRTEPPSLAQYHMDLPHASTHLHQTQITPSRTLQATKKKIFQQSLWMMTFGLKIQFQIDIYVFMNNHSYISCVPTHAHTAWTHCHTLQKMLQHHTMK